MKKAYLDRNAIACVIDSRCVPRFKQQAVGEVVHGRIRVALDKSMGTSEGVGCNLPTYFSKITSIADCGSHKL